MTRRPAGMAGPYVGRGRELAALAKLIAGDDLTGVVLIGGEAGLGKTRLIEEVIAAHPSFAVVRGGAVPRTTPSPFELIRTAVGPIARTWSTTPPALDQLSDSAHAVLSEPLAGGEPAVPVVEQIRAAAELLRALHTESTLFVFEDIHWADPSSLEVVDRLIVAGPLDSTVLVTYRPEALRPGHPVNTFLRRAERRTQALQIRLEPLRRDEVAEYLHAVRSEVGERTIDRVHGRTGGNPLFLSELVGAADDDADLTGGLPWTLSEILRPEIERLPSEERSVAEAVAVLGADAEFELVAAAVAVGEDDLLDLLRHLVDAGILVESGPDRFDFRHELVREAVAEGLFTRERRRIHGAAHDALVAKGSNDEIALITHAEGAGRLDEAADAARAGAISAMERGSSHQALALAERALLVHGNDLAMIRTAVSAAWLSQQHRTGLDHLARWEELVGDDPVQRAGALHWRVRLLWDSGDVAAADRAADELQRVADELEDPVASAQALADVAQHLMLSGRYEDAVPMADRAIAMSDEAPSVARQARAERASALLWSTDHRETGVAELMSVAADAESAGDFVVASRALHNVPVLAVPDPRRHLERMRIASQRAGLTCIATDGYRYALLDLARAEGDRDEFATSLDAALSDMEDDPTVLTLAATLAASDRRFDDAREFADRLAHTTTRDPESSERVIRPHGRGHYGGVRALVELQATGATEGVTAWLRETPLTALKAELVLEHASLLLDAGLHDDVLTAVEDRADVCCSELALDALAAELRRELDRADELYCDVLTSKEARSAVALAEVEIARARIATARGEDDRPHLEAAGRRVSRWPGRVSRRLEASLGTTGRDDSDPRRLTPREHEVAQLVAEGLTNGGIADALFISTKTASVHVSNILAKLGMSSRAEIAAWVASGGLAGA